MADGYYWKLKVRTGRKYNPSQPRVPAGQPEGGRWTAAEGSGPGIPYSPTEARRLQAERYGDKEIERFARSKNVSKEEAEQMIFERLDKDLGWPIKLRRSLGASLSVLDDGRFKTQFETGTSGGGFNPGARYSAEQKGLGVPPGLDVTKRPVYAAVGTDATNLSMYGDVEFTLKEDVKRRSTIVLGDSLYSMDEGSAVGTPYLNPTKAGFDRRAWDYGMMGVGEISYIEVQVHGGLTVNDVAAIKVIRRPTYSDEMIDRVKNLASRYNIKVEVVDW